MEILDPSTIAFLLLAGFIAAFIDSTVGGGGLISTPALLALGLPVILLWELISWLLLWAV